MKRSINIVELIENNPITRLTSNYQSRLLTKIKEKFTDNEQQMFVASFYCFLNYNQQNDFVIDLDDVWKWLEFSSKQNAKVLLEKQFVINKDYVKSSLMLQHKQSLHIKGGNNKEIIMLTIRTFKLFCLKAGTKKAEQIHDYYIHLEETLQEIIQEESNELKLQLQQKNIELQNVGKDKEKIREKTLLEQFPNNTQCVYYGIIDNVSGQNEKLIKFGNSNHLRNRVTKHKDTYLNFRLINAFKVENKFQIENAIKENPLFIQRQRNITLKNKKYIELLSIDGITFAELDKIIKEIITGIEYSRENYIKILEDNLLLKKQLEEKNEIDNTTPLLFLTAENKRLKFDNIKLIKKYNLLKTRTQNTSLDINMDDIENEDNLIQNDIQNYETVINQLKKKYCKIIKNQNGKYDIDNKIYEKLYGTREDVWNSKSYKTTGGLIKDDLMINKNGKIVSKRKCIQETINNRFKPISGVTPQTPIPFQNAMV